jgi:hypothetical protein
LINLSHPRKSAPDVRDGDGTADDEGHVESINDFIPLPAFFGAANEVIRDAVVAAKDRGSDESEKFLCFGADGAGFVGLMIESEESFHAEMAAAEDFLVEVGAKLLKVVEIVGHCSSGESEATL